MDVAIAAFGGVGAINDRVVQSLVISLAVVMNQELANRVSQRSLTERSSWGFGAAIAKCQM